MLINARIQFNRDGGGPQHYRETVRILGNRVTVQVAGIEPGAPEVDLISSDDPAVIAHHREIDAARLKVAPSEE